jgi:hypothetical protein
MALIIGIVCLASLVIGVTISKPKIGALLIWPILMCYPTRLWYELNLLPVDAGYDDLFIVFVAIMLLWRSKRLRVPWSVGMLALFAVVISIGNVTGMLRYSASEGFQMAALQEMVKTLIFATLGFCIFNSIDNEQDLRRCIEVMAYSLILGAGTIIASYFSPEFAMMFTSPTKLADPFSFNFRPAGTFGEPNSAAAVMVIGMGLVLVLFTYSKSYVKKLVFAVGAILMVAATLLARSRSGAIGLLCLLPTMLMLRGLRKSSIVFSIAVGLVIFMIPDLYEPMIDRVGGTFDPVKGEFSGTEGSRPDIWLTHLGNIDEVSAVLGNGRMNAMQLNAAGTPHSGYLDLLCFSGAFGLLWFAFLLRGYVVRIAAMMRNRQRLLIPTLGRGMVIFLVALLWCSVWSDTLSAGTYELLLLAAMLALVDRTTYLYPSQTRGKKTERWHPGKNG